MPAQGVSATGCLRRWNRVSQVPAPTTTRSLSLTTLNCKHYNIYRYYGMGQGIGFTREQCEKMWGEVSLDDHIMIVHSDENVDDTTEAFTTTDVANDTTDASTTTNTAHETVEVSTTTATPDTTTPSCVALHEQVKPGDSIEVWWEECDEWYACVVVDEAPDVDGTTASCCLYDGEKKARWHNLQDESYRSIPPERVRVSRMKVSAIRARLKNEGVTIGTLAKKQLVELLVDTIMEDCTVTQVVASTVTSTTPTANLTPTLPADTTDNTDATTFDTHAATTTATDTSATTAADSSTTATTAADASVTATTTADASATATTTADVSVTATTAADASATVTITADASVTTTTVAETSATTTPAAETCALTTTAADASAAATSSTRSPVTHTCWLKHRFFFQIQQGRKKIDGRPNDDKWKKVKIGDIINQRASYRSWLFPCRVKSVTVHDSFHTMLRDEDLNLLLPGVQDFQQALAVYADCYPTLNLETTEAVAFGLDPILPYVVPATTTTTPPPAATTTVIPTVTYTTTSTTTTTTTTPTATDTTTSTTTVTTSTPVTTATTIATVTTTTDTVQPGDSLEVWWEHYDTWYPCVVKDTRIDVDETTASLCLYDDEVKGRWHNLEEEQYRRIPTNTARVGRVGKQQLLQRLKALGKRVNQAHLKAELVSMLVRALAHVSENVEHDPEDVGAVTDHDSAPASLNDSADDYDSAVAKIPDSAYDNDSTAVERAKYGQSHAQRRTAIKNKQNDRLRHNAEKADRNTPVVVKRRREECHTLASSKRQKLTAQQVVDTIGKHGLAMYTLSTRGSRRDDRQHEREGYNLLIFSQKKMLLHDPGAHVWRAGDEDMSLLPAHISSFYNTTGWKCINLMSDGDGVVFLRPPAPMPVRGCGALGRRKNFKWTTEMGVWLHKATHNLTYKSTPFVSLVRDAEMIWGYAAPKQEHLENKIRSRDKGKKEGQTVAWVLKTGLTHLF